MHNDYLSSKDRLYRLTQHRPAISARAVLHCGGVYCWIDDDIGGFVANDVMLSLVVSECEHLVKECTGGLEDKLRAAMNAAKDHWMVLDKDVQLRGAIGAVMLHYGKDSEEYKRLAFEVEQLRKLSAFLTAAQA